MRRSTSLLGLGIAVTAAGLVGFLLGSAKATGEQSGGPAIVDIDPSALEATAWETIGDVAYWRVTEGKGARASGLTSFETADGRAEAGLSRYEKVTLELRDWPIDEFMLILSGEVEITDASGKGRVYGPGDAFVMPKGFTGTWKQRSEIRKIHVAYRSESPR